jgi:hypothetical protein
MVKSGDEIMPKLAEEEKQIQRKSMLYTFIILFFFLLISWFWFALRGLYPPVEREKYEIVGAIDFGDLSEGSQDVNTFEKPSERPSPDKPVEEKSEPQPDQPVQEEVIATEQPSETQVQTTVDKPKKIIDWNIKSGGANDGNADKAGNKGSPDAGVLNPDGMYAFGDGDYGLMGRKVIQSQKPVYNVQDDSRITYELVIAPNGTVKDVIPRTLSTSSALTQSGKDALRKWKFNDISSNPNAKDQRLRVTITFKLK